MEALWQSVTVTAAAAQSDVKSQQKRESAAISFGTDLIDSNLALTSCIQKNTIQHSLSLYPSNSDVDKNGSRLTLNPMLLDGDSDDGMDYLQAVGLAFLEKECTPCSL